ncbi:MAG: Ig-like domain-containing protein [Candidatus Marinimicrobia bacterium]|nr:Ig-like domain-containing protein [Candidatus Neomarinimicrobiota bacterium]MCF7903579.1 Ig-like domain-containing protein [Candidatus Neomarinimicrobiota bacterium]
MKTKLAVRMGLLSVLLLVVFSCEEDPASSKIGPLYVIEVTPAAVNMEIDSTQQFTALGRDADMNVIEDLSFTWTSRYPEVGTVDQTGLFTAISSGTTFLTAKSGTVESAQVMVTVYDPVFSIVIQQDSLTVYVDATVQFTAVGKDMNGNDMTGLSFTWETGNTAIATIDKAGVATGITPGNTTVTAKLRAVESLSAVVIVREKNTGTLTDIDGNIYQTKKIGDQWWLAENLKVTHYRNGDAIPEVTDNTEWTNLTTGAYCEYDNNPASVDTYGRLYNWYAATDSRNIAPEGWHVPTDDEWKALEMTLGMSQSEADDSGWRGTDQGSQLAGNADLWTDGNLENNAAFGSSGFAAFPGGCRLSSYGYFGSMGGGAYFWSSTEYGSNGAWYRVLLYGYADVDRNYYGKQVGFSVRLVRD